MKDVTERCVMCNEPLGKGSVDNADKTGKFCASCHDEERKMDEEIKSGERKFRRVWPKGE